jgi:hypothetical protein
MKLEDAILTPWLSGMATYIVLDPVLGVGESIIASIALGMVSSWAVDYSYKNFLGY